MHRHKCHFCGYVWEHADTCDVSHNAVPGSHECKRCGRCNWQMGIYTGIEPPTGDDAGVVAKLLAFIHAAQSERELYDLSRLIVTEAGGLTKRLTLSFGRGYFRPDKVLVYIDGEPQHEADPALAVDAFVKGEVPPCSSS